MVELLFDHILTIFPTTIWPGFPAAIRAGPSPTVRLSFDHILTDFSGAIPGAQHYTYRNGIHHLTYRNGINLHRVTEEEITALTVAAAPEGIVPGPGREILSCPGTEMKRTETRLETTKETQEVFGYLHIGESPAESPRGASIRLFRGRRWEAQARIRTRVCEGWREGRRARGEAEDTEDTEEEEKEKAGRNGISVLRRPTYA